MNRIWGMVVGGAVVLGTLVSMAPDFLYARERGESRRLDLASFDPAAPRDHRKVLVFGEALWDHAVLLSGAGADQGSARGDRYFVPVVGEGWRSGEQVSAVLITRIDPATRRGSTAPALYEGVIRDALWERVPRTVRKRLVADHGLVLDPNMVQIDLVADRLSALITRLVLLVVVLGGGVVFALVRREKRKGGRGTGDAREQDPSSGSCGG
jgi:hypothetical protein